MSLSITATLYGLVAQAYGESSYGLTAYGGEGSINNTGGLADTGFNVWLLVAASAVAIIISLVLLVRLRQSKSS